MPTLEALRDPQQYVHGTLGSLVLGCSVCGGESMREIPVIGKMHISEICGCDAGLQNRREPQRVADLKTVWFPLWKLLGCKPMPASDYEAWLDA